MITIPAVSVPSKLWGGDGSWVFKNGKRIRRSKNLRGLLEYARQPGIWVERAMIIRLPDSRANLYVFYSDGAVGTAQFADFTVAEMWVDTRVRHSYAWGGAEVEVIG